MKPSEYIKLTAVTDLKDYSVVQERLSQEENAKLFHYLVGLSTESGELLDAIKKSIVYGKPLDKVNLIEELGDACWYIARACETLNISMEEVMEININKLKKRYGEKFSEAAALNRDLTGERAVLEQSSEPAEAQDDDNGV
jgi:NTP pyrophosphatase (non-canonical NTP hydrolase)